MIPWEEIDRAESGGPHARLTLHRRGEGAGAEWSIRSGGIELMNSRLSGSERALAERAAGDPRGPGRNAARVLVGGLGMGYTLAEAVRVFPDAQIAVAEISHKVIEWNRSVLADVAGRPLDSDRIEVRQEDVGATLAAAAEDPASRFSVVLLDVDNGPEALSQPSNEALYSTPGLSRLAGAIAPGGLVAFWSAGPSDAFERRMGRAGWAFERHRVSPRADGKGRARHWVWVAARPRSERSGPPDT